MNRITIDELKAAYEKTGFLPGAGLFEWKANGKQYCCAFSVLYYEKFGTFPKNFYDVASDLGYGGDYIDGFVAAWDCEESFPDPLITEEELCGYRDGQQAFQALHPAYPDEKEDT